MLTFTIIAFASSVLFAAFAGRLGRVVGRAAFRRDLAKAEGDE